MTKRCQNKLKPKGMKFYSRYGDLIKQYEVSLSQMLSDILWHASRECLPFRTPDSGPHCRTCLCPNCWGQIPRTCHLFTRLFTSNTPWYFLGFAWPYTMTTPYWSDFVPSSTLYRILSGFHRTFAMGVTCRQRSLTPPDTEPVLFVTFCVLFVETSDTLYRLDVIPVCDITGLNIFPVSDISLNIGFHRAPATDVACWQGTLTPPDTWSSPFGNCICSTCWDQSFSRTCRYFSGLCSSNIPRYFLDFASIKPSWSYADSPFLYPPAGHVVTGDLTCIPDKGVRSLFKKGAEYRLSSRIAFTKCRDIVEDALQIYC